MRTGTQRSSRFRASHAVVSAAPSLGIPRDVSAISITVEIARDLEGAVGADHADMAEVIVDSDTVTAAPADKIV